MSMSRSKGIFLKRLGSIPRDLTTHLGHGTLFGETNMLPEVTMRPALKEDLTNQLLAKFKELISQGVLTAGVKLPPERELAQKFGVSRSSLRHALKVLDVMGVLTQRVGDGTYVTTSAARILSEPLEFLVLLDGISLSELAETRLIVEPELAARAAERATTEDLAALLQSLKIMETESDERTLIEADLAFHQTILRSSDNRLCERLFSIIHRSMTTSISLTSQLVDWNHTVAFHRPIYNAIDQRDPKEARCKMTEHLNDAKELLERLKAQPQRIRLPESITPIIRKSLRRR
jgi:GntR family transcriptional regulator, transcriptional repressor for pyruvate dehydrogenase complex